MGCSIFREKNGGLILIILSIVQLLVGGGLAPISLGVIAGIVANWINRPLTWWQVHLPLNARKILSKLFPCFLVSFLLLSLFDLEIAVSGNNMELSGTVTSLMFGFLFLSIIAGFARDISENRIISPIKDP